MLSTLKRSSPSNRTQRSNSVAAASNYRIRNLATRIMRPRHWFLRGCKQSTYSKMGILPALWQQVLNEIAEDGVEDSRMVRSPLRFVGDPGDRSSIENTVPDHGEILRMDRRRDKNWTKQRKMALNICRTRLSTKLNDKHSFVKCPLSIDLMTTQ